tara:strand:+ start:818 stop:1189 length:372 start_codon:yes stop_codon:yes gene_type:complete
VTLSTGDLERMRNGLESLLPDTCTIQSVTQTGDGLGGQTSSWANTATNVECRLDQVDQRARNAEDGDQQVAVADWFVTLHHDQAITLAQRIVTATLTLHPIRMNTDRSWKAGTRVMCRLVETG